LKYLRLAGFEMPESPRSDYAPSPKEPRRLSSKKTLVASFFMHEKLEATEILK
jgi:hypothetical protein